MIDLGYFCADVAVNFMNFQSIPGDLAISVPAVVDSIVGGAIVVVASRMDRNNKGPPVESIALQNYRQDILSRPKLLIIASL